MDGEHTGNTSPISMLHPQHIHFVVFGHMVQRLVSSNGIRHGSSWYLASGRIAFAFSSQYRLTKFHPIFMCLPNVGAFFYETVSVDSASWRVFPTFRSRRVELLVCRIWRTCALSPAFPSIYDFSMQCTSWRYQMNQKEQNRSQQGKEHTRQSWRFGTLICFLRVL